MTGRVGAHAPASRIGAQQRAAERGNQPLRSVHVSDFDIQVRLLRTASLRPAGPPVVSDPLEREYQSGRGVHRGEISAGRPARVRLVDRPSEHAGVEAGQLAGVGAVNHDTLNQASGWRRRSLPCAHSGRNARTSVLGALASQASAMSSESSGRPMR